MIKAASRRRKLSRTNPPRVGLSVHCLYSEDATQSSEVNQMNVRQSQREPFRFLPQPAAGAGGRIHRQLSITVLVLLGWLLTSCSQPHEFAGTELSPAPPAAEINGINWDGTPFSLQELQGRVVLLFFGYTSCPDVCPTTLAEMKQLYSLLGGAAQDVAVVLITVDPERDTVEQLAQFVPAFDPAFYGVYLAPDELQATKEAYGIYAEKVDGDDAQTAAGYLVDHSGYTLVVDRQGRWRVIYSYGTSADEMLLDIRYLLRR